MNEGLNYLQLKQCPSCEYSLQGLPAMGKCPECGFSYDDKTIELTGISRGVSTLTPLRRILWILIGLGGWIGPSMLILFIRNSSGKTFVALAAICWFCMLVYLLVTGKSERKGVEKFLFTTGGFGPNRISPDQTNTIEFISWAQANEIRLQRKGAKWQRVQIGWSDRHGGRFSKILLDAGMHLDQNSAEAFEVFVNNCIANAARN